MSLRIWGLALACSVFAACTGTGQSPVVPQTADAPVTTMSVTPGISHITVVIMENYDYEQVIGSSSAPYTNSFANAHALFTNSYAVTHPSEPNYLALFSGSTQNLASDACPVTYGNANLASELAAKGYTFAGYAENWPGSGNPCSAAPSSSVASKYLYWRKHIPWADFTNVPYANVTHAYGGPGTAMTANVNFVVPNICNDMHDCGVASGDNWLSKNVPAMLNYANTHNGLLIVTFDEGEYSTTNHVLTIAAGPMVRNGRYSQTINHYNVLRLIEDNFGLPLLGKSAAAAQISGVLSGTTSTTTSGAATVTGKITWVSSSATKLQLLQSNGASIYVDETTSTQKNYSGTPKAGEYAKATGTNTSPMTASAVWVSTSPF